MTEVTEEKLDLWLRRLVSPADVVIDLGFMRRPNKAHVAQSVPILRSIGGHTVCDPAKFGFAKGLTL